MSTPATESRTPSARKTYRKAVGPGLKKLLLIVFVLSATLAANSVYLGAITLLEWATGNTYQDYFYLLMFLGHVVLGLLLVVPLIVFGLLHMRNTFRRKNRRAVTVGYALFGASILLLVTGLLLVRITGVFDLKNPAARNVTYWLHVACPLVSVWLYWLHRLAGPPIKWKVAVRYGVLVGAVVLVMVGLRAQDPRKWNEVGPSSGEKYFEPSSARTASGNFIPAETLMNDQYCIKCHQDVHEGWKDSVHHFSSFNNPAYLATIRQTRDVLLERDGNVQASRWCAGCHDPVPFFSGAFDDPNFDDINHETAHAGITCTVCHSITHVNSNRGNADYTIDEPTHYPFASSENEVLQWINNQLVKAKPSFHKKTFLKPLHKDAEFCASCHKVHLPKELNQYKEFLRGQNHYDSWLLSGVSGHGARSFYYPDVAQTNCNGCHMPLKPSNDFGAGFFGGSDELSIHDHLFPSANTAIAWWRDRPEIVAAHQQYLQDITRVDIFGLRDEGKISGKLHAPLRPTVPELERGKTYLLETVIRTLKMGHHLTQGTADSNELWLDITLKSGDRVIGRSGALDEDRKTDPWSHFVNVFMLDKDGDRIATRNAEDIVIPLYNNQIPPGAGQTVHFKFTVPDDITEPVSVELKLQYRKFDGTYTEFIAENAKPGDKPLRGSEKGEPYRNSLPITTMATDRLTFPVDGIESEVSNPDVEFPLWQRWNDFGIGLLMKGSEGKSELRQAEEAFREVEKLGRYDGPLNLARVYFAEGDVDSATFALQRAAKHDDPPAPPWTLAWLNGLVNSQQGRFEAAEDNFRSIIEGRTAEMVERKFDFSRDYVIINLLGQTLFDRAKQFRTEAQKDQRINLYRESVETYQKTLVIDSENVDAHYNLSLLYGFLSTELKPDSMADMTLAEAEAEGEELPEWKQFEELAEKHRFLHERYKPDDNARGRAVPPARQRYPAANHASEGVVIYDLQREGTPGLDESVTQALSQGDPDGGNDQ